MRKGVPPPSRISGTQAQRTRKKENMINAGWKSKRLKKEKRKQNKGNQKKIKEF